MHPMTMSMSSIPSLVAYLTAMHSKSEQEHSRGAIDADPVSCDNLSDSGVEVDWSKTDP